jgi:transposase
MVHLSTKAKEAIVQKVLSRDNNSTIEEIAKIHNIGYSTLQRWVKCYRDNISYLNNHKNIRQINNLSSIEKFQHLVVTSSLDDVQIGAYCRRNGLFKFQLQQWKDAFMKNPNTHQLKQDTEELKLLRMENKKLKQEVMRKDRALAETAALLVLQKKTSLIWGVKEED